MVAPQSPSPAKRPGSFARRWRVGLAAAILAVAACSPYPLGMSEEEWKRLTPEQQMQARMKQAELNRAHAERRAQEAAARRQRMAMIEAAERRRVAALYQSGRFGDVVECVVDGGLADFRPGWHGFTAAPFTLARGEQKYVTLRGRGRQARFWAEYSPDGLEVTICYRRPHGRHGRRCATMSGLSADFTRGMSDQLSVDDIFRDARLLCAYRPGRGMQNVIIHQYNTEPRRIIYRHHYHRAPPPVDRSGRYRRIEPPPPPVVEHHYRDVPPPVHHGRSGDAEYRNRPLPPAAVPVRRGHRPRTVAVPSEPAPSVHEPAPSVREHDGPAVRPPEPPFTAPRPVGPQTLAPQTLAPREPSPAAPAAGGAATGPAVPLTSAPAAGRGGDMGRGRDTGRGNPHPQGPGRAAGTGRGNDHGAGRGRGKGADQSTVRRMSTTPAKGGGGAGRAANGGPQTPRAAAGDGDEAESGGGPGRGKGRGKAR